VYGSACEECMPLPLPLLAASPSMIMEGAAMEPTREACVGRQHQQQQASQQCEQCRLCRRICTAASVQALCLFGQEVQRNIRLQICAAILLPHLSKDSHCCCSV
jgi:hypothetical protein